MRPCYCSSSRVRASSGAIDASNSRSVRRRRQWGFSLGRRHRACSRGAPPRRSTPRWTRRPKHASKTFATAPSSFSPVRLSALGLRHRARLVTHGRCTRPTRATATFSTIALASRRGSCRMARRSGRCAERRGCEPTTVNHVYFFCQVELSEMKPIKPTHSELLLVKST